ncbi:UDP-4-amino-4,6-dideoxy-N-acetyl-beta-L-altrosamine transaminase [bacterium]|nr:UDP-4-amino-4,6-dideoxy-N-acetyl-beta-L-altrosamine transaminase [bacterium]
MIPYGKQSITEADKKAVEEALCSGWLTTGPKVSEFESAFAEKIGAKHAIAVSNATAALQISLLAVGIKPGQRVVTSPNTFLASATSAALIGAIPDFCDIELTSYNLCPTSLANSWQADTKAVVAVDYAGQTANMPAISKVARDNGAVVIEDACHAVLGEFEYQDKVHQVGNHPWADITTFSFHPVKTMTTGEGGMIVTNNDEYARAAKALRTHGMVRTPDDFTGLGDAQFIEHGPWYYEMQHLGLNARITDFQCALGLSQLSRVDSFLERRREIVHQYNNAFANLDHVQIPELRNQADAKFTSWHLYTLLVDFAALGNTRSDFMTTLGNHGIGSQVLYIPVYLQPWFRNTYGYGSGKCPNAEAFYLKALSLPLFPSMTQADVHTVINAVKSTCDRAKHQGSEA